MLEQTLIRVPMFVIKQMSEEQFQAAMLAQQQLARMHAWRGPHPALTHPLAALSLGLGMGLGPTPPQQAALQQSSAPHQMPPVQMQYEAGGHQQQMTRGGEQHREDREEMARGHPGQVRLLASLLAFRLGFQILVCYCVQKAGVRFFADSAWNRLLAASLTGLLDEVALMVPD
jgi:hypothetical protein